ncbi:MAG: hypothetical protein RM021_020205 [Nostoc sp. EkiNYC01]
MLHLQVWGFADIFSFRSGWMRSLFSILLLRSLIPVHQRRAIAVNCYNSAEC